jgi:uncharacterized small protein (DUF1192 family)
MGNRHTSKTVSVTSLAAKNMAIGLRLIADEYEKLAEKMQQSPVEAAGLLTGMEGLARVAKFCANIQEAYYLTISGEFVAEIAGARVALLQRIDRLKAEVEKEKRASEPLDGQTPLGADRGEMDPATKRKKAGKQ